MKEDSSENLLLPIIEYPSGKYTDKKFTVRNLKEAVAEFNKLKLSKHRILFATWLLTYPTSIEIPGSSKVINPPNSPRWRKTLLSLIKEEAIVSGIYPVFYNAYTDLDRRPHSLDWDLIEDFVNLFGPNEKDLLLQFWKYNEAEVALLPGALLVDNSEPVTSPLQSKIYRERNRTLSNIQIKTKYVEERVRVVDGLQEIQTNTSVKNQLFHRFWIGSEEERTALIVKLMGQKLLTFDKDGNAIWIGTHVELTYLIDGLQELRLIHSVISPAEIASYIHLQEKRGSIKDITAAQIQKAKDNYKSKDGYKIRAEITELLRGLSKNT